MKNIIEKNVISACNVVGLQSTRTETVPGDIRDSDLIIDLRSDVESCDNENSDTDINKKCLSNEYNFQQDIEKLIEVSKQFQTDYENEQAKSDTVSDDYLCIPILTSNSLRRQKTSASGVTLPVNDRDNFYFSKRSSRKENIIFDPHSDQPNKSITPTKPYSGPFGTGIIRSSPKKHSCVQVRETTTAKRSRRFGWSAKPYTSRYYNFDRTHPNLKLVESGASMIPKRISKETTEIIDSAKSTINLKPLLNKGLTWHEFFERCNVYSAKSFQSPYGNTHTSATQSAASELPTPKSNDDNNKIQKHILPQLNIRAECCVQRIPEISISPCGFIRTTNTNIKLVEIIYEESDSMMESTEKQGMGSMKKVAEKIAEPMQLQSNPEWPASVNLELVSIDESTDAFESKTCSSMTPSKNSGYDSSLEESISLNVSRASALTSRFTDHEIKARSLRDVGIQTQNLEKVTVHTKHDANGRAITSSSDYSRLEYNENLQQPKEVGLEMKLPTFPTNELVQMVDEIFDTSSDAMNLSYKYVVRETSVQTDIVWKNINDLFKQQNNPIREPTITVVETEVHVPFAQSNASFVKQLESGVTLPQTNIANESEKHDHRLQEMRPVEGFCRHGRLKTIKICSCLACKGNVRFSAVNIDESIEQTSDDSSSSPVFDSRPIPSAKVKLLPSERYKRMKQAQREHFENDPRISRTLKKIYATARKNESRKETTSSTSSGHYHQLAVPPSHFSTSDEAVLEPDLFTFSDEILLFGLQSFDEFQYSSNLLKTVSSQDTSTSIDKYYAADTNNQMLLRKNLFCTNSEESSCNSVFGQRISDLEQCLLKDIENSGSDPSALNSLLSTSSLERKINQIRLED